MKLLDGEMVRWLVGWPVALCSLHQTFSRELQNFAKIVAKQTVFPRLKVPSINYKAPNLIPRGVQQLRQIPTGRWPGYLLPAEIFLLCSRRFARAHQVIFCLHV